MSAPLYPRNSGGWFRLLFGIGLLIAVLMAIRAIDPPKGYLNVPKEVLVNYVPADFHFQLDEEYALGVLTHPVRYQREFDEMVRDINEALLAYTSRRMGLPDSIQQQVIIEYQNHHDYLSSLYLQDFLALVDSTSSLPDLWYENKYSGATDMFREVASKYTCFLTSHVISTAMETSSGRLVATGSDINSPCGVALQEALNPMMDRLRERAAIADFAESRGLIQEKAERLLSELATLEIKDKKGLNKQLQTEVFGFPISTTDITITAISILKVGFDLSDEFQLNLYPAEKVMVLTLPEPKVVSHEVYPKLENLSIGWLRELSEEDLNRSINVLRAEFRREAMESGAMEKAKSQAEEIMQNLFAPMFANIDPSMNVRVQFQQPTPVPAFNLDPIQ